MRIETIFTGDEVITGFIDDTNFSWFAQTILDSGLQIKRHQTVADNLNDLVEIITERSKVADVIIVNGGLGPTADDKTTEAVERVLNIPLYKDENCVRHMQAFFKQRGRSMDPSNLKQALFPQGATIIPNDVGTACGYKIKINNALCYFTPGVPYEFKLMLNKYILQDLLTLSHHERTDVQRYFVLGISESTIGGILDKEEWPENIVLGYRAAFPIVEVKLISRNASVDNIKIAEQKLLKFIEPCLVSKNEFNIPSFISKLSGVVPLQVIESGTGGLVLSSLSSEMSSATGHLIPLPKEATDLIAYVKNQKQRTIAIGPETDNGYSIVYWNGISGFAQTIKATHPMQVERKKLVACAVLDMVKRILSGKDPFPPFETLQRTYSAKF